MSVTIRAVVSLEPGCKLYYDCPLRSDSYSSQNFFDTHRGKYATFKEYSEKLIDVLDLHGRIPGRYVDPKGVVVEFDGEDAKSLNILHFVVADASKSKLVDASQKDQRLGDLPHPLLFYPGDTVRFKKKPDGAGVTDDPRKMQQIFLGKPFTNDSFPRYEVMETESETAERIRKFDEENAERKEEHRLWSSPIRGARGWNTAGDDIELVARGNVWALYNDPTKLAFESDDAEAAFWAQDGICRYVQDEVKQGVLGIHKRALNSTFGLSLEDAHRLYAGGHADVIASTFSNPGDGPRYEAKRMHDCFAQHRARIRALTYKLWSHKVKQSAA